MAESPTIEEIARLAEVSRSTVSRVLNNHPSVRPAVRNRVLAVIRQQNYTPYAAARSLASNCTHVLGLLIPRSAPFIFADPFFAGMIQAITEACSQRGYFMMLAMMSAETDEHFYDFILRSRHFDGMLLLSSDIDDPILARLIDTPTPIVLIGSHPYFDNLAWVDAENHAGAQRAVAYLIGLGHRRIGAITGPLRMAAAIDRRDGYKQALLEAGLTIAPELIVEGGFTQESGYWAMSRLLGLRSPPSAVFVASDTMAIGALRAIEQAGLRVPGDVSLIGFDDLPTAMAATTPLTTVRQPIAEMGATAVGLLIDRIEKRSAPASHLRLPTELIIRSSCGAAERSERCAPLTAY
jgi:LacI family transcriptional regulator